MTHFIVGAAAGLPVMLAPSLRGVLHRWAIPVTAGLFGVAPDLDTLVMLPFPIAEGSLFDHRGFFHSPFFLALLAFAVARLVRGTKAWMTLGILWTCAAITHPLLDMLTDGGLGVVLLFPGATDRLFFPWRPIRVSPLDVALFLNHAGEILWSELPFCIGALALGWGIQSWVARARCYPGSDRSGSDR